MPLIRRATTRQTDVVSDDRKGVGSLGNKKEPEGNRILCFDRRSTDCYEKPDGSVHQASRTWSQETR